MPNFFSFQQGSENKQARINAEASPLLGRFRAVPRPQPQSSGLSPRRARSGSQAQLNLLTAGYRGSVHVGYGALLAAELEDEENNTDDELGPEHAAEGGRWAKWVVWGKRLWRKTDDTWVTPKPRAVKRVVDPWWSRWAVMVVLPAVLVGFRCQNCYLIVYGSMC